VSRKRQKKKQKAIQTAAEPTTTSGFTKTAAESEGAPEPRGPRGGRAAVEERVLGAARELFAEKGYAAVSVREIAAQAGVSHALVYRYLGSKLDVLAAVLQRNQEWIVARASSATTLREAALTMVREIRRDRRDYFKLVARLAMSTLPEDMPRPDFPAARRLLEVAEEEAADLGVERDSVTRQGLVAALIALAIGWTVLEDLLLPVSGLEEAGDPQAEAALERALLTLIDGYASEGEGHEGQPRRP
jgi:TetR/AcrR family transcriptional regulator, repressor for neighboring sulfatase